jgi:hypothetical protein
MDVLMPAITLEQARSAKQTALRRFQRLGQVVGVGITRVGKGYAVKVNLREPVGADVELPTEIDGVPVRIEITGPIRARSKF